MSAELATRNGPDANAIEQALVQGNLAGLTPVQRIAYYNRVCESLNLNPLTKPFEYVTLNGKLQLYARKDCTDQLRKRDSISIRITAREMVEGVYVVIASATDKSGRIDEAIGAVPIGNLQGEARANAMMKAETKAKRRVSLSFCGLGIVDESEVDSIPAVRTYTAEEAHGGEVMVSDPRAVPGVKSGSDLKGPAIREINFGACETPDELRNVWLTLTPAEQKHYLGAKDKRKAELATEGKQGSDPLMTTAPSAARTASTAANATPTSSDSPSTAPTTDLPKRPKTPTPKSVSDLLSAVAFATSEDEGTLIGVMFSGGTLGDADSLETASPSQLAAADAWLRERASGTAVLS